MSNESEELVQKLVDKFRSLLDEALVVAIASDHDLKDASQYESAQTVLEGLAQHVTTEEATGFNPSGISNMPDDGNGDEGTAETNSQQASRAHDTDTTSASDQTSTSTNTTYSIPRLTSFDDDSEESKVLLLQSMFSELKDFDIKHCLKKANGDVQTALDELLNIQYLKSTGQEKKGIDGFFEPEEGAAAKKKRKNRKKGKKALGDETPSSGSGTASPSPDDMKSMKRQDEIAYLADRLDLPFAVVSDIYYNKKCASGAAAVEILDRYMSQGIETQDREGKKYALELAQKYQNVPAKYMSTIVQVTGSISQESDDIAALVSKHFVKNPWTEKLDVSYQLTPLPAEDLEGFETATRGGKSKLARPVSGGTAFLSAGPSAYAQAAERAGQYNRAKRDAAASAASLNRRGASNPLYRQAAGYYSERAREQARYEMNATSTAADLLVNNQSSSTSIDLHGVYVQDGVRIARQRVQAWWNGLGEFRSDRARQQPFTVITGLGRHSAGGVSHLRQAVAAALLQDGWKMQVETGRFVVKGRR
ncbi:smr protein [Fusarium sporotrichioides]|uniref:Smr protein n=1 Tax=Fusarium sporotrichioides TaxID=5514 RepID=A0A395SGZ4_FUSSP|nr:smr protein [Fusarium sporotrichioides]